MQTALWRLLACGQARGAAGCNQARHPGVAQHAARERGLHVGGDPAHAGKAQRQLPALAACCDSKVVRLRAVDVAATAHCVIG